MPPFEYLPHPLSFSHPQCHPRALQCLAQQTTRPPDSVFNHHTVLFTSLGPQSFGVMTPPHSSILQVRVRSPVSIFHSHPQGSGQTHTHTPSNRCTRTHSSTTVTSNNGRFMQWIGPTVSKCVIYRDTHDYNRSQHMAKEKLFQIYPS